MSRDGRYVAFTSWSTNLVDGDTNDRSDVFVRDRWTRTTTRVSVGSAGEQSDNSSWAPDISADGRYVVFVSLAPNLAGVDANNDGEDVFVHDRWTGSIVLASASLSPRS